MKVLIFIVAYNAEKTIQAVIDKIPVELGEAYDADILIIDDSSDDNTFFKGFEYSNFKKNAFKVTILKNPVNQGYGGNQKLGYHYAINQGYDVVALLHGDGQYAPEKLPDLIAPVAEGSADAVFGSRMMTRGSAIKGGMPLYKYFGNRILTWCENRLLKSSLTEFHSGYRVYSVRALEQIPFEFNTNDFHFDTEIIIQLLKTELTIHEIPIPTYYGDEICYVNGLKYAKDVIKAVILNKVQDMGLLYDKKYDCRPGSHSNQKYSFKLGYASPHSMSISMIEPQSSVLDLGCGAGYISGYLKKNKQCHIVGVDREPVESSIGMDQSFVHDLNTLTLPVLARDFDYVLLLDIIEHLNSPEAFMECVRKTIQGNRDVYVLVSVPNVAFFMIRLMLLFGQFNYGRRGILDLTHTRLFTFKSLRHFFLQTGFEIVSIQGVPAPFPLSFGDGLLGKLMLVMNQIAIRVCKGLFSYQIFAVVKPLPGIEDLLEDTRQHSRDCLANL